jgi:hypothetical protein
MLVQGLPFTGPFIIFHQVQVHSERTDRPSELPVPLGSDTVVWCFGVDKMGGEPTKIEIEGTHVNVAKIGKQLAFSN